MKKEIILLALIIALPILGAAQQENYAYLALVDKRINSAMVNDQYGLTEESLKNIEGSPYESSSFLPGAIYTTEKKLATNVPLRYNIFADEIEMKKSFSAEDSEYSSLVKDPEYFVKIRNDIYVFIMYNGSVDDGGYFNVLTDGKHYDLYKKSKVTFIDKQFGRTNYERDTPAHFKKSVAYYLVSEDGTFYELPNKKNKLIDVFSAKSKEIKKYIKDNNIDIKEEKGLVKIVDYYNSII